MTTVGFGDFFPVTYFGRLTIIVACFVGIFVISLTMVTMNNSKDHSMMERKSFVLLRRITQRVIVNRFAGLSVLNFLKSVKSKHKLNRNPDNPIHKSDLIQAEETLERLIEQFRSLRKELKPEEVPQEEKIRIILEKLNGDVQRIAEELIQHQKNFHLIDMYVQSQQ